MPDKRLPLIILFIILVICSSRISLAQRQMEYLDRGVVAVPDGENVFVSWRLLGTDDPGIAFNIYRIDSGDHPVRLNSQPISTQTHFLDTEADPMAGQEYMIRSVIDGKEAESSNRVRVWENSYLRLPLNTPDGYSPNDASIGDLDGDGSYEIVLQQVGRSRDNSQSGFTDPPILEAYELDGLMLWRINLGIN
ncbi:MAG: hypothetical protein GF372_00090, partial [Candidatus Marinimicrobia bacterium]|nr:hypothetical protein [Candidatus Neomarinimicrobiota bacterium]